MTKARKTLYDRVMSRNGNKSLPKIDSFPVMLREKPHFTPPVSMLPGPGSFGPVSIGGIIRHS